MLMKLEWLKRSACPQCRIDQLTITKNGDVVRFCLQGFSCQKEAKKKKKKINSRDVLFQEVKPVLRC